MLPMNDSFTNCKFLIYLRKLEINPTVLKCEEVKKNTRSSENDFICKNICQRETFRFLDLHDEMKRKR